MLKQRVLMAEKYEKWEEVVRESKGESERLRFMEESEGKRLIPFCARKKRKKCKICPLICTNARLCIFGACFILLKSPENLTVKA